MTPPERKHLVWLDYGGPAWSPDAAVLINLPARVYPIVDQVADNYGQGLIIEHGGLDFVVNDLDLGYPSVVGWSDGTRVPL